MVVIAAKNKPRISKIMPSSVCRFIKQVAEFRPREDVDDVPTNTRGIYALLKKRGRKSCDVVYIGCSAAKLSGIHSRLRSHCRSKRLQWTHFSVFEVHDNITREEVRELEGMFLHIYRKDTVANKLNRQLRFRNFTKIRRSSFKKWR
jgi:hypothetical protein